MLQRIEGLPDTVLGITATGTVTAHDYETVLIPAVEALLARHRRIRFLYHFDAAFSGFEFGAIWDDAKIGMRHLSGWERIAVVSDMEWLRTSVRLFGLALPAEVRVFSLDALDEAKRWVSDASP